MRLADALMRHAHDHRWLIYFADWSPSDPAAFGYNRTIRSGSGPSTKGETLVTLACLLRGTKAQTYTDFTTSPGLKPELNEQRQPDDDGHAAERPEREVARPH